MRRFTVITFILIMFSQISWLHADEGVDFTLPGFDGKQHKISDYRGKWILANYWATWCPPCLEEITELEIFHNKHKDSLAVVLGINNEDISENRLKEFVSNQFISYPILRLKTNESTPLGRVSGLPTSFLINPEGKVVAKQVGTVTATAIEKFIKTYEEKNK